jgi:GxxExxY protein
MEIDEITEAIIDEAMGIHRNLGPGLLESVYEMILARKLKMRGLDVSMQKPISFDYEGLHFDEGFRCDLLVENQVVVELKSVEAIHPVHQKQLLTYLKLMNLEVGLLINFGAATLKEGLQRVVNHHSPSPSSKLSINSREF